MTSDFAYPTPEQVLNQILNTLRWSYDQAGLTINVAKGTEPYKRMEAISKRISIALNNNKLALSAINPYEAVGADLEQLAAIFGVSKRAASSASGNVIVGVVGGGSVTIPINYKCTAPNGIAYQTTSAKTVADNGSIQIQALSSGTDTDQAEGTIITWDSAAIGFLEQTCTVAVGGIDGGSDADGDEDLRRRLLRRLRFPEVGGNWSQVMTLAENASASVLTAFVYPALRGGSSYDVAVMGASGDQILATNILNTVASSILANMGSWNDLNTTSFDEEEIDVLINMELPLPVNAGGRGGGWRDATPWPSTSETGAPNIYAEVTSIANLSLSKITVNSTAADPPKVGDRFGIWNPGGGTDGLGAMHEFTVSAVSAFPYEITIDTINSDAIDFIETGMYCSAGAFNLKSYALAFRDKMKQLGPGEKTDNIDIIPRAGRKPSSDVEYPMKLGSRTLDFTDEEILDVSFEDSFATGTYNSTFTPTIPTTTADPPKRLTLANLAIRRQV
jgi:hypothetical protein